MHSTVLIIISSTLKEDIGSGGVSLQKLEVGDDLRVGFPSNSIVIQIVALPWQLFHDDRIGYVLIYWPSVLSRLRPIVSCTE